MSDLPSPDELMRLCAVDHELYARTFFADAFRQASPPFAREVDKLLWNPNNRYVALKMFRGSSKTTRLRVFTSKRIAYGISRTILFVSNSQNHSVTSVTWLRNAVERNHLWAGFFGLRLGSKEAEDEIEIFHGIDDYPIRVKALGITGQVRGYNFDNWRPDLIVLDDPDNEETTATKDQRDKTQALVFGALQKSLAPTIDAPDGKMVLLQTPFVESDTIDMCCKDPQWVNATHGCFDDEGVSVWEERFPTKELEASKESHIKRNQLSLWMREMECKIISSELSAFRQEWLKNFTRAPSGIVTVIGIDPASSEEKDADYSAVVVIGFYAGNTYLCEYALLKTKNPYELTAEFFRLAWKWKPIKVAIEAIAYQRVLASLIRQEMVKKNSYWAIEEVQDRRRKWDRIIQALSGRASEGRFYIHPQMFEFIEQFAQYPATPSKSYRGKDDLLDAAAMAITSVGPMMSEDIGDFDALEGEYRELKFEVMAP